MKKPRKIMTTDETYYHLVQADRLPWLLIELQNYLRSKLKVIHMASGSTYYTCGHDHRWPGRDWKPFKHRQKLEGLFSELNAKSYNQ